MSAPPPAGRAVAALADSAELMRALARRWELLALGAIVLLAIVLRLVGLNAPLWFDEIATLTEFVRRPVGGIVSDFSSLNNHVLYSLQAKAAIAAFGESAWALRLPAAVFGVASILVAWRLARSTAPEGGAAAALAVAALTTLSYHHIWFSQNARGYTEMMFWCLAATLALLEGLERPSRAAWAVLALSVAAALYTHLTAAFYIAALGAYYLFRLACRLAGARVAAPWGAFAAFAAGGAAALAFYAPAIPGVLAQMGTIEAGSAVDVMQQYQNPLWTALEGVRTLGGGSLVVAVLAPMALAVFAACFATLLHRAPAVPMIFALHVVISLGVLMALSMRVWPRFFFIDIVLGFVILAQGGYLVSAFLAARLSLLRRFGLTGGRVFAVGAALAAAASAGLALRNYASPKQDFAGAIELLTARGADPATVAALGLARLPYETYYQPGWRGVESVAEIESLSEEGAQWLIVAFPTRSALRYSEVADLIEREFVLEARLPGTLGDGAILVYRRAGSPS